MGSSPLPRSFYLRPTAEVAVDLLGRLLVRREGRRRRVVRIVEVEAYLGIEDRAAHTFGGRRTPRVEPMWGEGGHAYVFLVYGMHCCLNVVTREAGTPEAILIRAGEPVAGFGRAAVVATVRGVSYDRRVADVPVLTAPTLLIAMPQVLDPFFARTVVLLVHHDAEGSLGYIVNRTTEVRVEEICAGLDLAWQGSRDAVAHFGGPVQAGVVAILYREESPGSDAWAFHLPPDLYLSGSRDDLDRLVVAPPADFRLLLGYAGWGPGQIDQELLRGDWLTAEPSSELIFGRPPDSVWRSALESIGVDPGALPSLGQEDAGTVN